MYSELIAALTAIGLQP